MLAVFLAATLVATYTACFRPNWFLAVLVCLPVLEGLVIPRIGGSADAISMGSVQLRLEDPGSIGLLAGILYHWRSTGLRYKWRQPAAVISGSIILFLTIKVLATSIFAGSAIASNTIANGLGGGFIAAVGEVRDALLALVVPVYIIFASRYIRMSRLVVPFIAAIGVILLRGAVAVADKQQLWSNTGQFRFITAYDAITLTILSMFLFYLPAVRWTRHLIRLLSCVGICVAILANHRSQWLACLFGISVLMAYTLAGQLPVLKSKPLRILCVLGILVIVWAGGTIVYSGAGFDPGSDTTGISTRLLALTNPERDPDSFWRMQLWRARIEQSRDNWVWGRFLGDRQQTLANGSWLALPNHNAYVTAFELGGVCLVGLVIALWARLAIEAVKQMRTKGPAPASSAPTVALAVIAASLAFGIAYDFPLIGPALATTLLLRKPTRSITIHWIAISSSLRKIG